MDYSGGNVTRGVTTKGKITVGYKIKNHRKISNKLVALPVLGLAAVASTVLVGAASSTFADTCPAATCSDTTTVEVTVGAVISLATPDKISVSMAVPSSSGTFASGTGIIGVSTNDASGYSVYITGTNGGNTRLTHETVSSSYLSTISSSQTISSGGKFSTNNTWGWGSDGSTYYPLQAYGTVNTSSVKTRLVNKSASTIGKTCTTDDSVARTNYECNNLVIGATGDTSLTAGTYNGSVLVTAVTNSYSSISDYDTDR